jgi:hypothetical protein
MATTPGSEVSIIFGKGYHEASSLRQWAHIVTIQKPMYEGNSASFRLVSCRLVASVGVRTRFGTEPRSSGPPIFASAETRRPRPSKRITGNAKSRRR